MVGELAAQLGRGLVLDSQWRLAGQEKKPGVYLEVFRQ